MAERRFSFSPMLAGRTGSLFCPPPSARPGRRGEAVRGNSEIARGQKQPEARRGHASPGNAPACRHHFGDSFPKSVRPAGWLAGPDKLDRHLRWPPYLTSPCGIRIPAAAEETASPWSPRNVQATACTVLDAPEARRRAASGCGGPPAVDCLMAGGFFRGSLRFQSVLVPRGVAGGPVNRSALRIAGSHRWRVSRVDDHGLKSGELSRSSNRFFRYDWTKKSSTKLVKDHQSGETACNDRWARCLRRLLAVTGHQVGESVRGGAASVRGKISTIFPVGNLQTCRLPW